jgi:copper chaperone CopZ
LFSRDREADLREAFQKIPELTLVSIDFDQAEVLLRYDHQKLFKGVKPDEVIKRLDNTVRSNSHSTFGIKPLREKPLGELTFVEIEVVGLDCKGCSWAAYQAISRMDGVERATASFKDGKVTAHIDAAKTNRAALEAALKQRQVTLKAEVAKP